MEKTVAILTPEKVSFIYRMTKQTVHWNHSSKETNPFAHAQEYQFAFCDHDYAVGSKNKLITSVINDMKVVKSKDLFIDAVSYSRPIYIVIQSLKHSGSSGFHDLCDMNRVHSLPEFNNSFLDQHSKEKKVMILTADGGFDDNARYSSTINCVI